MILFLLLGPLVVFSLAALVRRCLDDRPAEPPRSRFVDPQFLPPAHRWR